jgi:hypothetical protein
MSVLTFRRNRRADADPVADAARAAELARLAAEQAHAAAERDEIAAESRIRLARMERDAARADAEHDRTTRTSDRTARRAQRATARQAWLTKLRPVAPLIVVNATAMYGQIAVGYKELTDDGTPGMARFAVAFLVAAAAELIANYVNWHAHDALLRKDGRTAGRLRRVAYLIAAVIGAVNYSHFADANMAPTAAAVVFGLMSASSPWLWGLHTRRAQHVQLTAEGRADTAGAVFSGERVRAFPIRAWQARRWSIDHGVSDPLTAWDGYNAARADRKGGRLADRDMAACTCGTAALPGVPSRAERDGMAPADLRDRARRTYLAAVANGTPVSDRTLGAAYGMRDRWARERIREARTDRTEP